MFKIIYGFCLKSKLNYYQILNVTPEASHQEIKAKYYKIARQYHPDKNPQFTEYFKAVNEAYQILKDSEKRKEYDGTLMNKNSEKTTQFYQRNYHYGQTVRKNETQSQQKYDEANPFAQGKTDYYKNQFANEYVKKNQKKRKPRSKPTPQFTAPIFTFLKIGAGLLLTIGIAQLIIGVYGFNKKK